MKDYVIAVLLALCLFSIACGAKQELAPQVEENCEAEGGCIWVSQKWLKEQINDRTLAAYDRGVEDAKDDARISSGCYTGLKK